MKNFLIATLAFFPLSVSAAPYDDTVSFSASAVCAELVGVKEPSKATDTEWQGYLKCIEVMHYFNTKYN